MNSIDINSLSDQELVALHVGDRKSSALATLVRRHTGLVYRFAYSIVGNAHDADDVAQETFVKVWKHLSAFDQEKSFKTWLLRIAKNTAIDCIRSRKNAPLPLADTDGVGHADFYIDEPFFDVLQKQELSRAIHALPPLYQALMHIRQHEDITLEEIADIFGEPLNTIKSRYTRALALLRHSMTR